jgi:rubrerythrin
MPAKAKKKAVRKAKKGQAYTCGICGYRIIVDEACGCGEEHVLVCCDQPMKKA